MAHELGHQLGLGDLDITQMGDASFNQPALSIMHSREESLESNAKVTMVQDDVLGIYGLIDVFLEKEFRCPKGYVSETSSAPNPQGEDYPNICRPEKFTSAKILDCEGLRNLGAPTVFRS